ncbi:MAG: hypothetical protein ACTTGJ_00495 [Clostridium sp.]
MRKNKYNIVYNNGITLVTLVLTIIILLILSVLVISLSLGDNGLLQRAKRLKKDQIVSEEKDKIISIYGGILAGNNGNYDEDLLEEALQKEGTHVTVIGNKVTYHHEKQGYNNIYTLDTIDGKIEKLEEKTIKPLPPTLEVGDTVIYDPTRDVKDNSLLTYTSEKGTAKTGGNGYSNQTVTAKSNINEWIVISIDNNQIKVMSKEPLNGIQGGIHTNFTIKGATGWLYAEEELNKICAVYGHGKGAVKTKTKYTVGNPFIGEGKKGKISSSGARSMSIGDLAQIFTGKEVKDFTDDEKLFFSSDYMSKSRMSLDVYYPTVNSDNEDGISTDTKRFNNVFYYIDKTKYDKEFVSNTKINAGKARLKNHIFKGTYYWIDNRLLFTYGKIARFTVGDINVSFVTSETIFENYNETININTDKRAIRPVVYLDGNMIEETSPGSKVWKIK